MRHLHRWTEQGGGRPIVFLSGMFGERRDWDAALDAFAPEWRFLVPEIPLFAPVVREPTIAEIARHVLRFLDDLEIESAVLCGNSIGAQVALEIAFAHPTRVGGLVLSGASGIGEHRIGAISIRPSPAYIRSQVAHVLDHPALVGEERIEAIRRTLAVPASILKALRFSRACRSGGLAARLGAIVAPALLVWGANDRITPRPIAERFRSGLANAELVLVPDAAHAPMLEQPVAFAAATTSWLRRIGYGARIAGARSA
jgi:pimeloyl-ACP methyl ester carboxylesterase